MGGTPASSLLGAARARAIVAISLAAPNDGEPEALCSGVVIGPRSLLTAKHCLDLDGDGVWDQTEPGAPRMTTIVVGSPLDAATPRLAADAAALHPTLDVALVEGEFADAVGTFIPPALAALTPDRVGTLVEIAGYGNDARGSAGALNFASESIAGIEDDFILVDGQGATGACTGDSGGALLARDDDGSVRVLGVLDHGDRSCLGKDYYLELGALGGWEPFATVAAANNVAPPDADCGR